MNENKKMSLNEQKLRRKVRRLIVESLQERSMAQQISDDADDQETGELEGTRGHTAEYRASQMHRGSDAGVDAQGNVIRREQQGEKNSIEERKLRQKVRRMIVQALQEQTITPPTATTNKPMPPPKMPTPAEMKPPTINPPTSPNPPPTTAKAPTQPPTGTTTPMEEGKGHGCASHVKEGLTGREGRCINHTLLEDGSVTHYTVEFQNEIVENIPVGRLTILEMNEHHHPSKRDDYDHDEGKPRKPFEEGELKNPEKADLDDDGELSGYEKARGAAIEKEVEEGVSFEKDPDSGERITHVRSPGGRSKNPDTTPEGEESADYLRGVGKSRMQRRQAAELEEQEQPLEEWYNNTLHEALLKKFKIKK